MTFNQVVWKMAKYHYRKYLFYIVCNSLAVMIFFMFTTLYFNEQIESEGLGHSLTIPGVALIMFTVFFISYAHLIFMKRRRSDFGLFMTLGMTNRDISRLLLLENSVIAIIALIIGIGTGTFISKLFFWLLLKSVGIQDIDFQITTEMLFYSVGAFLIVFAVALGQSLYLTMKRNIIESLKNDKISENVSNKNPIVGGIGLLIVIGSIIGLYYTYTGPLGGEYLLLWSLATFLGLYIALYQFTSFIIDLVKRNKNFYYRRLLYFTSIDYKYKQLTSIMMLVTVMIMVTLLYSTIILSTYINTEKEAIEDNPYDVGYIQTDSKNNLPVDEVYSIFAKHENTVQEHTSFPVYSYFQTDYYGYTSTITFMPISVFNEVTTNQFELQDDEFIYYLNGITEIPEITPYDRGLRLSSDDSEVSFHLNQIVADRNFNYLNNLDEIFIINDSKLINLKDDIDGFDAVVHLMNIEKWQESEAAVNELEQSFESYNAGTPAINVEDMIPEEQLFRISSIVDGYHGIKNSNGILFFVTIFLSILFFVASLFLLYMQLFSEVDKETEKIRKLYRIGITSKEVKKMISQEITTIFMMPTVLGMALALLYIIAMATDIGGVIENPEILFHFLIIAGIYFFIQVSFLFYARKKMFQQINNYK